MSIRTNNIVQFDWRNDDGEITGIVFDGETTSEYTLSDAEILHVLEYAMEERPEEKIQEFIISELDVDKEAANSLLTTLEDNDFLLSTNHPNFEKYDEWFEKNWQRALFYHLKTRTSDRAPLPYDEETTGQGSDPTEMNEFVHSSFDEDLISLPDPKPLPDSDFREVALRRRTHRNFKGAEMTAEMLSSLLYHTFEPVREAIEHIKQNPLSEIAPDAVRKIGFEVYPAIMRCDGIPTAIYKYSIVDHALSPVKEFESTEELDRMVVDSAHEQPWVSGTSVGFYFSSVFNREQEWVPHSRGLRNSYICVAEHAHRLILVSTAFRLRNFMTPALKDSKTDSQLGLDGFNEAVTYLVTIGE